MNVRKSKVMIGSIGGWGGGMLVHYGKWPCGVCVKGLQANSVKCSLCKQ